MHAAIKGIGMLPRERDNEKVLVREPQLNFPDVYNRVLGVPEILLPILRYVVLGEGTRVNILRIASVSHLWREVVCDVLHSQGIPAYEFKCDNKALLDWDEYFVPGKIPLGYLLPVGLQVTESEVFRPEIQHFIRRHSERVVEMKLIIYQSDMRLLHILETFKLNNLVLLKLSFPTCKAIWPEDSLRTVQSLLKASTKLKDLSLDWEHCTHFHISYYTSASRWFRQTLDTKLESRLVGECSDWRLEKLSLLIQSMGWSSVFDWILRLSAPTIRELEIKMDYWSIKRILLPEVLVFPNLTTLRLVQVRHDDGTVCFDLLRRFPNLKFIHILDAKFSSTTLFDQFFPESMPICPTVQAFTYKGADLSESQCSRLFTCLPNCIKLGIDWYDADYANKSIRKITRNMTQLKILEVYLSGDSRNEVAEHIDDWTFAGVESTPEVPRLERIRIHTRYPETLTRNIVRNVPIRIPTLMSLQILRETKDQAGHGVECRCPECKRVCEIHEEFKSNNSL